MSTKQKHNAVYLAVLLAIIASTQICAVALASFTTQNRASAFIEEVLPINSSQWHVELKVDAKATDMSAQDRLAMQGISTRADDDVLIYFLGSMVGTADSLEVIFIIRDNNFIQGIINADNAPSLSTFNHPLETANITNFLTNYRKWSGLDSSKMSEILPNIDIARNSSFYFNDFSLIIQHSSELTELSWSSPNGSELGNFQLTFKNDFLISFKDGRHGSPLDLTTPTQTGSSPSPNDSAIIAPTVAVIVIIMVILIPLALLAKKKRANRRMYATVHR